MKLILTVIDNFAPSEKYPQFGFSIDFKDNIGNRYYVEYPNNKSNIFNFEVNKTYEIEASIKEVNSFLSTTKTYKISRLKNIVEIDKIYAGKRKVFNDISKKLKREEYLKKSNIKKQNNNKLYYYAKLINLNKK